MDEYYTYATRIFEALSKGGTKDELVKILREARQADLHAAPDKRADRRVIDRIVESW